MTVPLDKSSAKSPPPTSSSAEFTSTESLTDKVKHLTIKTTKIEPDRPHSRLSPSLSCEGSHSALDEVHHYSLTIDGPLQNLRSSRGTSSEKELYGDSSREATPSPRATPSPLPTGTRRKTPSGGSTSTRSSRERDNMSSGGSSHGSTSDQSQWSSRRSTPQRGSSAGRRRSAAHTPHKQPNMFESYASLQEVQSGLKRGEVIEGVLRINPKNYEDAYISAPVILGRGNGHIHMGSP